MKAWRGVRLLRSRSPFGMRTNVFSPGTHRKLVIKGPVPSSCSNGRSSAAAYVRLGTERNYRMGIRLEGPIVDHIRILSSKTCQDKARGTLVKPS